MPLDSSKKYLGRGLVLPLSVGGDGDFKKYVESDDAILSSIKLILITKLNFADNGNFIGERLWRPDFGSQLANLKHEPNTPSTYALVRRSIIDPVNKWEPRIKELNVAISPSPRDPYMVLVFLSFKIRATNEPSNLVIPFFLDA